MGITTNVRFMTKLVNAASKERRWVMAVQLLQLMRSYGVTPNDVTFTSILSEMAKAKQVGHGPMSLNPVGSLAGIARSPRSRLPCQLLRGVLSTCWC